MRRVALKGLWLRRGRVALTGLAVVLGVAMVSGTYVLTDTISRAFDEIFSTQAASTSAVITGREIVSESASGDATLPESLVDDVLAVDGVADAAGAVGGEGSADQLQLIGADGKPLGNENAPGLGFGFEPEDERFNPLTLTAGRWAAGPREVVVDKGTADEAGLGVGDEVGVSARGEAEQHRITGVARFGTLNSLGGATIAVLTLERAQELLGKEGRLDSISVEAAPGLPAEQVVEALEPVVPATASVRTAQAQAAEDSADVQEATTFIRTFLLAFAGIALAVGAFVISNTLSITVAQRIRELATLRTLGASRAQIRRSVLLEGLAVGVAASVVGLALGWFLAKGLNGVFRALGIDLPRTDEMLLARTVVVSLALGIVVTVLASLAPARRATRIAPVAALQEGATLPPRLGARRPAIPAALLVLAAVALGLGASRVLDPEPALLVIAGGTLLAFTGVAMLANRVVPALARVLGAPARRAGPAGRLASRNAARNPQRTATTAAALMIGLALVTLVATLGAGVRDSNRQALEGAVSADLVLTHTNGFEPIPASAGEAAAGLAGARVYPVRFDRARAFGKGLGVTGVPADAADVLTLRVSEGPDVPGPGQALVETGYAEEHDLRPGSALTLTTPGGERVRLEVAGLLERTPVEKIDPVLSKVVIAQETFDAAFPRPNDQYVFVEGTDRAALAGAVAGFPNVEAFTRQAWIDDRVAGIATLLNLLYVLLALSVVVSLFGMVNTLVLSVFERTREIGMLRAVGMSRRQVRRMVRQESVVTALIGATLGLPLGLALAALVSSALAEQGLGFAVPAGSLVVFTLVAVAAGVVAAIAPARRASRLDVLEALQYE